MFGLVNRTLWNLGYNMGTNVDESRRLDLENESTDFVLHYMGITESADITDQNARISVSGFVKKKNAVGSRLQSMHCPG